MEAILESLDLVVQIPTREVWWCGQRVTLQPRPFDLLVYLIAHRNRVVTKSELLSAVWSGDVVVPDALTTAIHNLRRALCEPGRNPRYIRTVHRIGYQWIAPVEGRRDPGGPPPAISLLTRAGPANTVNLAPLDAPASRSRSPEIVALSGASGEALLSALADRLGCERGFDAVRERLAGRPIVLRIEATDEAPRLGRAASSG